MQTMELANLQKERSPDTGPNVHKSYEHYITKSKSISTKVNTVSFLLYDKFTAIKSNETVS